MQQRNAGWLILIGILVAATLWVVVVGNVPGTKLNFTIHQGLDLQGGLQALLEADVPNCSTVSADTMSAAKTIVEDRVNGLGVAEPVVQMQGACRIVVELPGVSDPQQAVTFLKQTALLEFVPMGTAPMAANNVIATDCKDPTRADCGVPTDVAAPFAGPVFTTTTPLTGTAPLSATAPLSDTSAVSATAPLTASTPVFHTLMTGVGLGSTPPSVSLDPTSGQYVVNFSLSSAGDQIFGAYTGRHIGEYLAIVLDKQVVSTPRIDAAITGKGIISGQFTQATANQLALQLRYGALPVPLRIARYSEIGPTLGQDSVRRSTVAGIIGLGAVLLFMLLYYRLPGVCAGVALLIYAVITLALFKMIPVTLTLPGIAGFVLSVGVAVDANILIFERMKEELRNGRTLINAVDAGFRRAWPSIRDSNISTLITCAVLYWFGNTFGASVVKGFALTLALGVAVSLFTAILVTRSILHVFLDRIDFSSRHSWFGI
jgi:preprotein translocase subunit SecD